MFNGTSGTAIKDSGIHIDDNNQISSAYLIPRVYSTSSTSTLSIDDFAYENYFVTALSTNMSVNSGVGAVNGGKYLIRVRDNGTSRAINFSSTSFRDFTGQLTNVMGILVFNTTISKTVYIGVVYNGTEDKWDIIAVTQEP